MMLTAKRKETSAQAIYKPSWMQGPYEPKKYAQERNTKGTVTDRNMRNKDSSFDPQLG
jgi:hypothetical protein